MNWPSLDEPADEQSDVEPIVIAPIANLVKQEDEATPNNEDNRYECGYDLKTYMKPSPGNSSFSFPWDANVATPITEAYAAVVSPITSVYAKVSE